jgi:hypothetical protein
VLNDLWRHPPVGARLCRHVPVGLDHARNTKVRNLDLHTGQQMPGNQSAASTGSVAYGIGT